MNSPDHCEALNFQASDALIENAAPILSSCEEGSSLLYSASTPRDTAVLFFEKQRHALLRDFAEGSACFIALSPKDIARGQEEEGWRIGSLPGPALANAFVIQKGPDLSPECWVRWSYTGYRKAFQHFLEKYFSEYSVALDSRFQVDHLLPRCRFKIGAPYFIRLHLVLSGVNASHGAGFERKFFSRESQKEPCGSIRMSWITYCKAQGIRLPGKNAGTLRLQAWAREQANDFSRESGENASLAYHGFLSVLRLGYTGCYAGDPEIAPPRSTVAGQSASAAQVGANPP